MKPFEPLIYLPDEERARFSQFIKEQRKIHIKPPKETAATVIEQHLLTLEPLLQSKAISQVIVKLRELSYSAFLKEEALFNAAVLHEIGIRFEAPRQMLEYAASLLDEHRKKPLSEFTQKLSEVFGTYAGSISPYIYELCLSNTQSRRSRAGKTFEEIIYFLYEYHGFAYESQSSIGKQAFAGLKLGKVVDSILPSRQAFLDHRTKTIVGSMKTTLRERWQEVVEEISRSNLPNIYLLTVDEEISESKAEQIAKHNLILVVLSSVKAQASLMNAHAIIDFETFFSREIPNVLNYWKEHDSNR